LLRRFLPFTTIVTILVALYTGWTLYSRHQSAAESERELQEKQAEADRKAIASFGGDELKILGFNAEKRQVPAGGKALMCYGVSNAVRVKIEPGVEPINPALSHCLEVFPKKTTTYTLSAEDVKGNKKSASLTISVRD